MNTATKNPFEHLIPAWERLTPEQKIPTTGSSIPTGGPYETLDSSGIEALQTEADLFDRARLSAARNLSRIIVA